MHPDHGSAPVDPDGAGTAQVLHHVLQDLSFPAHRWQIVTVAEAYGVDHRTRAALRRLRAAEYRTFDDLVSDVARHSTEPDPGTGLPVAAAFTPSTRAPVPDPRHAARERARLADAQRSRWGRRSRPGQPAPGQETRWNSR